MDSGSASAVLAGELVRCPSFVGWLGIDSCMYVCDDDRVDQRLSALRERTRSSKSVIGKMMRAGCSVLLVEPTRCL